ncbi:MAG: hypothetical protein HeimC3_46430 [Candidatus Heimdallarchaeota archaeon LC_3]|nr:MAG: hypothetical protein HeimC3_46430 [Candidatus Heimdallarchaeota archaeon LC_3]
MKFKDIHFSVTDAKTAALCPRKFIIKKKYGKKIFKGTSSGIGTLVHHIISKFAEKALKSQRFIDRLSKTSDEHVIDLFRDGMRNVIHEISQKRDFSTWKPEEFDRVNQIVEILTKEMNNRYNDLKKNNNTSEALKKLFIAVEWGFNHSFNITHNGTTKEVEIGGRIDWLSMDVNNQTMTLWDFKTGSADNLERDIPQVAIYSIIIEEEFGIETAAALMYISPESIEEHRVEPQILKQFKSLILKTFYKMDSWMKNEEEIPHTIYLDACEDCIVSKFCLKKFGSNPHLEELGIKEQTAIELDEKETSAEDPEEIKEPIVELEPEKDMITKEKSDHKVDMKREEKIDLKDYLQQETTNAIIGTSLKDKGDFEIQPRVFLKHVVTLGASGSGKTVLGKVLIEEILKQGYSAILIDPQGDLCSLALPDDEEGKKLVKKTKIKIYTPNSTKGIKLTIEPLSPPAPEVLQDHDTLITYLDATATQLLDILGYSMKSIPQEKAFLEAMLKESWQKYETLDFKILASRVLDATTIQSVQDDSLIDVELLLTSRKQKELSQKIMKLAIGTEGSFFIGGESIDFDELTTKESQLSIINLASVGTDQTKRQLVVSWILRMIYDWLLRNPQKEQDKIRFFLYIDEVADFLPAHPYNPPSKKMLMLLMRQARKYGCSILLATQSPAAIDYKAIDNVGTLFIGRIPTKQSIEKVEAFLEPYGYETQRMVKKVMTVKPGEFMMIGGGYTKPEMFKTRWLHTKHQTLSLDDIEKMK